MRISGFSFARNADKHYYPVVESIRSILPICDEFIIAIGKGDSDDRTRELVSKISDPRIRIIDTEWTDYDLLRNKMFSMQTNLALSQCSSDWCFYLQADEVVHERFLDTIHARCAQFFDDREIEGLLFRYKHFWGDYHHYHVSHAWYPNEIRIIRNGIGIESVGDAQSFRRNGRKLNVATVDAEIFHYGYVRPPRFMHRLRYERVTTFHGAQRAQQMFGARDMEFIYGSLEKLAVYRDSVPKVMERRVKDMDWADSLQYTGKSTVRSKHDRLKYRLLTFLEKKVMRGRYYFGYKNWQLLKGK